MKIVYVTSRFPTGPSEAFIAPEIAELERQGHEVIVVPLIPERRVVHEDAMELAEERFIRPLVSPAVSAGALVQLLEAPGRSLRALFSISTLDIRHMTKNLIAYPKSLWLARLASRVGARHIHAHWSSVSASMAMAASIVSGIPWSFTAHRWDIVENNLLARKARRASFARFISRSGLEMAARLGVPAEKAVIINMGVSLPATTASEAAPRDGGSFRLLCPANLLPVKGHEYLLRAVALVERDVTLLIAGEGPSRSNLEALARELRIEKKVVFLGQLPHRELLSMYERREVDAVVLASVNLGAGKHEGIPVALVEAMAHALPVIATATGGIPELVGEGCGLLVPEKDPEPLARAIETLASDEDLAASMGARARKAVEESFDVRSVAARLSELFSESG